MLTKSDQKTRLLALAETIKQGAASSEIISEFKRLLMVDGGWRAVADLVTTNEKTLITHVTTAAPEAEAMRLALRAQAQQLKADLGHKEASAMERLLIEQVALSWLRLQVIEFSLSYAQGAQQEAFYDKRLSAAQARFLRSCESLTRIRKMMTQTPALQINIASQQVNQVTR